MSVQACPTPWSICGAGDTLVVWWLDRLGRLLKDLIERPESLRTQSVGLRSFKEAMDTDLSTGQIVLHIFGALAEFEQALIPRAHAGGTGRARLRTAGRPAQATGRRPAAARC